MRRILLVLGLLVALTSVVAVTSAFTNDEVCPGLDSGKIDTTGDPQTVTVTAPDGFLISGYCVKGGSEGPIFVTVDPPVASLTFDYPGVNGGGQQPAVSHYSLSYVEKAPPTTVPPTTVPPTTEPPPTTSTTSIPDDPPPTTTTTTTEPPTTTSTTTTEPPPTTTEPPPTTVPPPTTEPPPTTVPPPTTDTTVPPPPTTDPPPPPTDPPTTVPTCEDDPSQPGCSELARTGSDLKGRAGTGFLMVAAGAALWLVSRKRVA